MPHFHYSLLSFFPAIQSIGLWAYAVLFIITFVEALPIIGLFVPGVVTLVLFGFISSKGILSVQLIVAISALGAFMGDYVGYYTGLKGIHFFYDKRKFFKESHMELGKKFFDEHGGKSVFLGRFIAPIRSIIPLVAGFVKMPFVQFSLWNSLGALVWSSSYILLGFYFGHKFSVIRTISVRISLLALFICAFFVTAYIVRKKSIPKV